MTGISMVSYSIPHKPEPHFPRSQPPVPVWQAGAAPLLSARWDAKRLNFLSMRELPHSGQANAVSERTRSSNSPPQAVHLYSNIGMMLRFLTLLKVTVYHQERITGGKTLSS